MKKLKLLVLLALMGLSANMNAQTIIVQAPNGANPRTFTDIDAAVADANPGDYVYFERGTYNIESRWTGYDGLGNYENFLAVEKPLHFVGSGYFYPAEATEINGNFALRKSASGSTITGIRFNNDVYLDSISNVEISRCSITYGILWLCGTGTNSRITECVIQTLNGKRDIITGSSGDYAATWSSYSNIILSKNIFVNTMGYHKNLFMHNNIFISGISYCDHLTMLNNIFISGAVNVTYSIIENNIYNSEIQEFATNTYTTNIAEPRENTFDNFLWDGTSDYHLMSGSLGIGAGTDGTDIGIYGTLSPFKEDRRTAYPQITVFNIGSETDTAGKLSVNNITVEAQDK